MRGGAPGVIRLWAEDRNGLRRYMVRGGYKRRRISVDWNGNVDWTCMVLKDVAISSNVWVVSPGARHDRG